MSNFSFFGTSFGVGGEGMLERLGCGRGRLEDMGLGWSKCGGISLEGWGGRLERLGWSRIQCGGVCGGLQSWLWFGIDEN